MHRAAFDLLVAALFTVNWTTVATGSAIPVTRCNPSSHICEGKCPSLPPGAQLPSEEEHEGLCLKDSETGACVCWLQNSSSEQHLQTLFKCEVVANGTVKHVMCLPPPVCFTPGVKLGFMIVLQCPCTDHGRSAHLGDPRWHSVVAFILRSKTPVPAMAPGKEGTSENPQADVREFSVKHLLFLLAFVIAPLLCWCLLTFLHEGKCRKKRRSPEAEPLPTERVEEVAEEHPPTGSSPPVQAPTAPKLESPPPYGEALDPSESCLLADDCGPPPSYEDAMRDQQWQAAVHRIQEV